MHILHFIPVALALLLAPSTQPASAPSGLPTLYIIGDSTVHNTGPGLSGWGDQIGAMFDTSKINVVNRAIGGRSSRTFFSEGRWDKIMSEIKSGDFVLMQFGHNDGGATNDNSRARGSLRGIGDETQEIDNQLTGKHEVVHTYGWYMRKYVTDAKSKGATPIICTLIPRNDWRDGKVIRATSTYAKWSLEIAEAEHVQSIDLHNLAADKWDALGQEKTTKDFFPGDHTHTSAAGAKLNAQCVIEGLNALKDCPLKAFIRAR